jgi:hypothetical protein
VGVVLVLALVPSSARVPEPEPERSGPSERSELEPGPPERSERSEPEPPPVQLPLPPARLADSERNSQ